MSRGPTLSIVMPVFNTGRLLLDSVRSIIAQTLFEETGADYWELLIVDDASTDAATCDALNEAAALSRSVRVVANTRSKGAAGARNTGVLAARGRWIGFLDSDDLWYPDFLRRQRDAFTAWPAASWRAAHFDVGDAEAQVRPSPLAQRSPCLHALIADDYAAQRVSRLSRPVDVLLRCGCLQAMTVQVDRDLIRGADGFDESLPRTTNCGCGWRRPRTCTSRLSMPASTGSAQAASPSPDARCTTARTACCSA